ncbi:short chain dehydrogenase [Actinoplanes bogorensis]|uniref:Short chain dehydrogenase n=1 Tax=Paractinoplanes bogorensis TaxID=1610840 RepID=A0ABS5Z0L7_9ACTN|nr:short chain dehydrogenase [Actinoplanes bogorensis]MBU2669239.1 short chain dehydrogenase [Actinoplanes bogorensis]
MRVLLVGAGGTLGRAVAEALTASHEVVAASRSSEWPVDLETPSSIDTLFERVGPVGAVVCCAASGPLVDLEKVTDDEFAAGLTGKLLGQIALARRAIRHLPPGGSVTLTGGTFVAPLPRGSLGATVNSALEGFVVNAAAELRRQLLINLVAPGWISETLEQLGLDPQDGTPAADVARTYRDLVDGTRTGSIIRP